MSSKHGRVVLLPAPAAPESQRLVRDARCARASSASSAPTPAAAGAFPLVRDHCHHQFAPPGAWCPEVTQGVPQALVHWCLYRDNTCEPCLLTVRAVLRQFARDPCQDVTRGQQFSCTKVLETSKSSNNQKRAQDRWRGNI